MRVLLAAAGFGALALGSVGLVLPLLPTTPFVLLAAACFARSSPRCHERLRRLPFFGDVLTEYGASGGVSRKTKAKALLMLWVGLCASILVLSRPLATIGLTATGLVVSFVILRLRACTPKA